MAIINDTTIPACICGTDKKTKIERTAKQRVITWMIVIVALGFVTLVLLDGFSLSDWNDPKGLVVLGLLLYCVIGVGVRFYRQLIGHRRHSVLCMLRRSFYDIV